MTDSRQLKGNIAALLEDAEQGFAAAMAAREKEQAGGGAPPNIPEHFKGLDLAISEEALVALSAAFAKSGAFSSRQASDALNAAIADITAPLIKGWIGEHLGDIAREVVREQLGQITKVRPQGMRPQNVAQSLGVEQAAPQLKQQEDNN